jgi:hypothetical protein
MTQEQVQEYSDALGWPPDAVVAWFTWFSHGGP